MESNKFGPGIWYWIHKKALISRDQERITSYLQDIRDICENFPCMNCSEHCKRVLKVFPPEDFLDHKVKEYEEVPSLFIWSWRFHNMVNKRLGKKEMPLELAVKLYRTETCQEEICSFKDHRKRS
jgi:hypothetical protein